MVTISGSSRQDTFRIVRRSISLVVSIVACLSMGQRSFDAPKPAKDKPGIANSGTPVMRASMCMGFYSLESGCCRILLLLGRLTELQHGGRLTLGHRLMVALSGGMIAISLVNAKPIFKKAASWNIFRPMLMSALSRIRIAVRPSEAGFARVP